jgi:hypothetical protein
MKAKDKSDISSIIDLKSSFQMLFNLIDVFNSLPEDENIIDKDCEDHYPTFNHLHEYTNIRLNISKSNLHQ